MIAFAKSVSGLPALACLMCWSALLVSPTFAQVSRRNPKRAEAITNSIGMKLVPIPPVTFQMGSPQTEEGRSDDEIPHKVTLTRGFFMQTTPVTQAQWSAVMGTTPSHFTGRDLPVEQVSWDDARDFCRRLGEKEGKKYRLPTEAEWECACRAGTTTRFYTGDGDQALGEAGWYHDNSGVDLPNDAFIGTRMTHPVGTKAPNKWGLYDMHGNVWQWCGDFYGPYGGDATDLTGPAEGTSRVLRGGSWTSGSRVCRAASRHGGHAPGNRGRSIGFRVCLDF